MKTRSAKAKGKRLERWIRDIILKTFGPDLTSEDVRITIGVETGNDVKLSAKAAQYVPFSIEAKNRETFKTLYSYVDQAIKGGQNKRPPLVIVKMNGREPLAIIEAAELFKMLLELSPVDVIGNGEY